MSAGYSVVGVAPQFLPRAQVNADEAGSSKSKEAGWVDVVVEFAVHYYRRSQFRLV